MERQWEGYDVRFLAAPRRRRVVQHIFISRGAFGGRVEQAIETPRHRLVTNLTL